MSYGGGSYGSQNGLWELAVLNKKNDLDYSTEITDDVLGWLSEEEVIKICQKIAGLPEEV